MVHNGTARVERNMQDGTHPQLGVGAYVGKKVGHYRTVVNLNTSY